MVPVVVEWGDFVVPTFGLFLAIGYLIAGFVFWRKLREDYDEERILSLSLFLGLVGLVSARAVYVVWDFGHFGWHVAKWLSLVTHPGLSLYGALVGSIFAVYLAAGKGWRVGEVWDATVESGLIVVFIGGLGVMIGGGESIWRGIGLYSSLMVGWSLMTMLFIKIWLVRYRSFGWYKSGRVGFVGWGGFLVFSFGHLIIERIGGGRLYWGMTMGGYLNVGLIVLSGAMIYRLSGRKLLLDLGGLFGRSGQIGTTSKK